MTRFDHRRLGSDLVQLDITGLRRGDYADRYFENVIHIFTGMEASGYTYDGSSPRKLPDSARGVSIVDMPVEAQVFNRREPRALVAGVDVALLMLRYASGYDLDGQFVERWQQLDVAAVEDGEWTTYAGHATDVQPILKIRGLYHDFAMLETPLLGILTRASRTATNVYDVLEVSNGKPVLFFPARFDLPEVQAADGYAYWLAVQCYNHDTGHSTTPIASTDAQGAWWGGRGGGTVPHALIATFLGDTVAAMEAYARYVSIETPRIVLADFENDCVHTAVATLTAYWSHYRAALEAQDIEEQRRWTLYGVRLDTAHDVRDASLDPGDETGVNAKLVHLMREALDNAWQGWHVPETQVDDAITYCKNVRIVATGGFNRERIADFERDQVPVDIYGVGSSFLENYGSSKTDYTMDVVRVKLKGKWIDMAKVGRQPCDNPDLKHIDLSNIS